MDTKSKKSSLYSTKLKVFALILIIVCSLGVFFCGQKLVGLNDEQTVWSSFSDSYFDTPMFRRQYNQLARDAVNVYLVYQNEDHIREGGALPEEKLLRDFATAYNIDASAVVKSKNSQSGEVQYEIDPAQLTDVGEYKDAQNTLDTYFPAFYKRAIQEQLEDYRQSVKNLNAFVNFSFCLVNEETGAYYGNKTVLERIRTQAVSSTAFGEYCSGLSLQSNNDYYTYDATGSSYEYYYYNNYQPSIYQILRETGFTLYCGVIQPLKPGDNFYTQKQVFDTRQASVPLFFGLIIGFAALALVLTIGMMVTAGRSEPGGPVRLWGSDYIFNDLHLILILLMLLVSAGLANLILEGHPYEGDWATLWTVLLGVLFVLNALVVEDYFLSIARQVKARRFWRNTMLGAMIRGFASLFGDRTFRGWTVFLLLGYGFVNFLLTTMLCSTGAGFFALSLLIFNVVAVILYVRSCWSLSKIMQSARNIAEGKLEQTLDIDEISASYQPLARNVVGIQSNIRRAVSEAVKGERMKTDLITNVSHDLKTPLTSMITYVDLLKHEDLQNPKAKEYVRVLDDKSHRLKQLIEDLVEASKVSSGNVRVERHRLNLRELILQATGEYEDKLDDNDLQVVMGETPQPVMIAADGKHLWRIAENLLSNVVKYAMPHSRVYIDVYPEGDFGVLSVKNVSANQITISTERLAERFIRGDEARTTEGSGLGLAITQSLAEIQGGNMEIVVDGDLFKILVRLPLWKNA